MGRKQKKTLTQLFAERLNVTAEALSEFASDRFEHTFDRADDADRTELFVAFDRLAASVRAACVRLDGGPTAADEEYEPGEPLDEIMAQGHRDLVAAHAFIKEIADRNVVRLADRVAKQPTVTGRKL